MAAPPLLSVARYGAFFSGYTYGFIKLRVLKGQDAKYQADVLAKRAAAAPATAATHHH
jgi:hypothetical protein